MPSFIQRLSQLVNEFSLENGSNTPDTILATFLDDCLTALNSAIQAREQFYGVHHMPGEQLQRDIQSPTPMVRKQPEPGAYNPLLSCLPPELPPLPLRSDVVNALDKQYETIYKAVRDMVYEDNYLTQILELAAAAIIYIDAMPLEPRVQYAPDQKNRLALKVRSLREAIASGNEDEGANDESD